MSEKEVANLLAKVIWIALFYRLARMDRCEPLRRRFGGGAPFALFVIFFSALTIPMIIYVAIAYPIHLHLLAAIVSGLASYVEFGVYFLIVYVALKGWRRLRVVSRTAP